ncbi:MAG: hypothetical protein IH592_08500, partial [Bacteroidales bacterium]|nr:hypothetical protein [Bacteroidales bacterium]
LETLNSAGYDDLEFFLPSASPGTEMDLEFRFSLYPWSVNGEEIILPYEVKYVDPVTGWEVTEYRAPVYNQETAFLMYSSLVVCSPCVPLMTYIISIERAVEGDIYQLIKNLIYHYNWPLDKNINDWEARHPAPARKPKMEIRYEKEYLSLLDEESRKMEVYIKVKNCHGDYVYDKNFGQPVYFLNRMERFEYKDGGKCTTGPEWGLFSTVYTNSEYEAIGEYRVIKGVEPTIEKPRFKTCGIGNKSLIEHEGEIIVLGLELKVEAERKTIFTGEKTSIQIDLHEIDPEGTEILSCAGKEVDVKITGLVDGTVSHGSGKITLNEVGIGFIDYEAGENDKQIKVSAAFRPPGYPEEVTGEAVITVKKTDGDFNGTIMYERQVHWKDESEDPSGKTFKSVDLVENATIHVAARYLRTIRDSDGLRELYEAKPLAGNFSVTMKKTVILTDNKGHWTKNVDAWQGDEMMKPESGSNILLTIEPQKKSYRLQIAVYFPSIKGTTEISSSRGVNMEMEAADVWRCIATFEVDGSSDGNIVIGHWSQPAIGILAVSGISGLYPGTTWNWTLGRTKNNNR